MYYRTMAALECSVTFKANGGFRRHKSRKNGPFMLEQNYWLTTVEMPTADGSIPLPESVDVAVIGAGFTGLSAARTLAKRGAKVAVL